MQSDFKLKDQYDIGPNWLAKNIQKFRNSFPRPHAFYILIFIELVVVYSHDSFISTGTVISRCFKNIGAPIATRVSASIAPDICEILENTCTFSIFGLLAKISRLLCFLSGFKF